MANQGTSSALWSFTTAGTATSANIPGGVGPLPIAAPASGMPSGAQFDLLWRHETQGWLASWQMNGVTMTGAAAVSVNQVSDTKWKLVGSGDLNGDGQQDVVWQHEGDGSLAAWYLRGADVVGTSYLSISRVADLTWKIRGVGDTNGDGLADLVWQNSSDGRLAVWLMNGTQVVSTVMLSIPRVADTSWKVRAVGDTDGDGLADLLWQNSATGELAAWFLRGATVLRTARLSIGVMTDANWRIVGAQDVGGDGRADILWQHSSGSLATWFLQGPTVIATSMLNPSGVTDPVWKVAGPR
jgi:hypothetical protein